VQAPERWFELLRRVRYEFLDQPLSWDEVAERIRAERQALAVVNTKKDAFALLDALGDKEALHLSTTLCGAHRRSVIEDVKQRLAEGEPCLVVSTQVVEAGVDLDFPVVLRAAGPLDSVIQAAGRCNREGRLGAEGGRVVVFKPAEGGMPQGAYRTAYGVGQAALARLEDGGQPDRIDVLQGYFRQLFESVETDGKNIQELRQAFDYPEVAHRYRLIEDDTESVVVPSYGTAEERRQVQRWLDALRAPGRAGARPPRYLLRRLQPYLVSVRSREAARYRQRGLLGEVIPGTSEWRGDYDEVRGLTGDGLNPDSLVV
jgi:CRISPR-associated endonuclease/helicase Cas3